MLLNTIPACFFPTTAVFVGSDLKYLQSIVELLKSETKVIPRLFDNSNEALHFLKKSKQRALVNCFTTDLSDVCVTNIEVNILEIKKQIYNSKRFEEVSLIVVDYETQGINMLEFLKDIQDKQFKKIIISDSVDDAMVLKAFNDGLLDKFIRKNQVNFSYLLNSTIQVLQYRYFQDLSHEIIDSLKDNENSHYAINDKVYKRLFYEICKENKPAEYYLADESGSYLFLDSYGNPSWLAIKGNKLMDDVFVFAEESLEKFPATVLKEMKSKQKILFLFESCYMGGSSLEESLKSLHPAEKLIGKNDIYYYAFIKDKDAYDIKPRDILSFKDYLRNI